MNMVERVTVGRKTAHDGKLEVSRELATALGGDGASVEIRIDERRVPGVVTVMPCTCAKAGASGIHEHHFVQSDAFRALPSGGGLQLTADSARLEVLAGP